MHSIKDSLYLYLLRNLKWNSQKMVNWDQWNNLIKFFWIRAKLVKFSLIQNNFWQKNKNKFKNFIIFGSLKFVPGLSLKIHYQTNNSKLIKERINMNLFSKNNNNKEKGRFSNKKLLKTKRKLVRTQRKQIKNPKKRKENR